MRKIVLLILLLITYSLSYGQAIDCVGNAGDTVCQSGSFRIDERLRLKSLPNTHALGVLTTNSQGMVILDTLDAATGVSIEILADTSDAIHSWVWSIVSNPTIDSYLYATRDYRKKGDDSVMAAVIGLINTAGALKLNIADSTPAGYATRARLQKNVDSLLAYLATNPFSYLTSFTESDPVFLTYPAAGIGVGDISNWNEAYDKYPSSASFNTSTGVLTITRRDGTTVTVDLDGRYLESETDPLSFHKADSNTAGEAITYSYYWSNLPSVSGYLQTSDTGTMLAPYLRKADSNFNGGYESYAHAAATYQPIGTYITPSDTATMLSPYLSEQHASVTYVAIVADTTISAAYTLTSRDFNRTIHCTNGSNIALTIPTGLGTSFVCVIVTEGAGTVTPTASSTTFYYQPTSTTKIKSQGGATIRSWATANSYLIIGSLE